jgi:hypothetical protein
MPLCHIVLQREAAQTPSLEVFHCAQDDISGNFATTSVPVDSLAPGDRDSQLVCRGHSHVMRSHLVSIALLFSMIFVGCASIMVPDPSAKSPDEQQRDRAECAAVAARAAQDYAWSPFADLTAIRATREAECLESRGYVTTTRVTMRPSPEGGQPGQGQPDPVRRCFQQAYAWLGRYDGPIDGRSNVIWTAAQEAYLTEQRIMSNHPDAPNLMRDSLQRDLRALGKDGDWQACLKEATTPQ